MVHVLIRLGWSSVRSGIKISTLDRKSCEHVVAEYGWVKMFSGALVNLVTRKDRSRGASGVLCAFYRSCTTLPDCHSVGKPIMVVVALQVCVRDSRHCQCSRITRHPKDSDVHLPHPLSSCCGFLSRHRVVNGMVRKIRITLTFAFSSSLRAFSSSASWSAVFISRARLI